MKKYILMVPILLHMGTSVIAVTPEQILADGQDSSTQNGVVTRKGGIKAFINNVMFLNDHLKTDILDKEMMVIIIDMRESIPGIESLSVFDCFQPMDLFQDEARPGSIMAGVFYLQQFPNKITPELKERLVTLSKTLHPFLKSEIAKLI